MACFSGFGCSSIAAWGVEPGPWVARETPDLCASPDVQLRRSPGEPSSAWISVQAASVRQVATPRGRQTDRIRAFVLDGVGGAVTRQRSESREPGGSLLPPVTAAPSLRRKSSFCKRQAPGFQAA